VTATLVAPVLVGCSHGTDNPGGRAAIRAILDGVRLARPDLDVRDAFVDVQRPAVAEVVATAVAEVGAAVVVPLLLSAGYHVHVDIEAAVAGKAAGAAPALGPDPRLVAILLDRLRAAGIGPSDAVVLAAAGSTDARAAVAVESIAAALRSSALVAGQAMGPVTIGYGAGATPRVPDAVAAARAGGAARVVVAAYLLAPGFFHDRLLAAGADVVTAPLAPDPRLVEIVLERYAGVAVSV